MKRAVTVFVGDELLAGIVVNTNAAMISELLVGAGYPVAWSMVVGDDEEAIVGAVGRAARDAEVVIVSGGLGPTQDDRTREALARLLGTELVRHEALVQEIRERFVRYGRKMPPSNLKQADLPRGTSPIPNPWGTAPGIRAQWGRAVIYAIPGVPQEARHMLEERILPELGAGAHLGARILHCVGIPESELADRLHDLATASNPRMAFLPGGGEIRLRFVASGDDASECTRLLDEAERTVLERVGGAVYGRDADTLEGVVGRMLKARGLTVATAESCTAGALAARIASVPGASAYLRGGLVAYASDVKVQELGVDAALLKEAGPVSEKVAGAMADAARERLRSDIGLGVTCAAGPDPQDGAPPGTLCLGVASSSEVETRSAVVPGDRSQVLQFATTFALAFLRSFLDER